ncbi:MAG: NAD-dependent epimerase/dehydratase family protein [Bacteroidota bacterium]
MKVLITGGAGFIGSNIVSLGVSKGHHVTVVDNLSTGYRENLNGLPVKFVQGDIADRALLDELTQGIDCVFHLAASVGNVRSLEDPYADVQANYHGTLNVLEAIRKNKVPTLVYSSTAAGYGEPVRLPIDEEHPFNPDSPYGITKIAGEKLALCYGRTYGFRVVCLRYFNAYGVNQRYDAYGNVIPIFATRIRQNLPLTVYGTGEQTRDFIEVTDIAKANWKAAESDLQGYFNVATGKRTSINQLIGVLREVSGKELQVNYTSSRKGEVLHSVADIQKATKHLSFTPGVSLTDGLRRYWDWFKDLSN